MPCVDGRGQLNDMARKLLAAMTEASSLTEIAAKTGLPLYRIRSGTRELVQAGFVTEANESYVVTEAGRAAINPL